MEPTPATFNLPITPFGMLANSVPRTTAPYATANRPADSSANLILPGQRMDADSGVLSDVLPDFRNSGVIGRIVLLVNVAMLFAVAVSSQSDAEFVPLVLSKAAIVEPILFASLVALYIGHPKLGPFRYEFAVVLITLFVMLVTAFIYGLVSTFDASATRFGFARALALAAFGVLFMLEYFCMRSRALAPGMVAARLQALQARIRPHFLFNSINAVLSLIRTDPRRAETVIEDLADLFRTLMADARQLVTLEDEIRLVRGYLDIEQLRLSERLAVHWSIEGAPKHVLVPPLFCSPWWRTPFITRLNRARARESLISISCDVTIAWRCAWRTPITPSINTVRAIALPLPTSKRDWHCTLTRKPRSPVAQSATATKSMSICPIEVPPRKAKKDDDQLKPRSNPRISCR
ncbi:MAG: histidine kinase [Betaproteobacteria bacterium]|nr:histidine kinase [Betaproteobacteria bacterium]